MGAIRADHRLVLAKAVLGYIAGGTGIGFSVHQFRIAYGKVDDDGDWPYLRSEDFAINFLYALFASLLTAVVLGLAVYWTVMSV